MKVALISGAWPPSICGIADGIFIYTRFLLEDKSRSAVVITTRGCNEIQPSSSKIRVLDIVEKWTVRALEPILAALKKEDPDIVHIEYPTREYGRNVFINILPVLLRLYGYKVVITINEYSFNLSWKGRVRLWPSIAGANAVLVSDPAYITDIRKVFRNKPVETIPIAPNVPASKLGPAEKRKLRRETAPGETVLLGYFGFINANKIVKPVLQAVKMLRNIHGIRAILLLIGDIFERDPSNPLAGELLHEIERLGIKDSVVSTGYVPGEKAADFLSILDYAVLLYSSGISPRNATFLAAAAQDIKIITTSNPAFKPGYERLFLLDRDSDLASGITDIVLKNGKDGNFESPASGFYERSWRAFVKKHLEVYRQVLNIKSDISK